MFCMDFVPIKVSEIISLLFYQIKVYFLVFSECDWFVYYFLIDGFTFLWSFLLPQR